MASLIVMDASTGAQTVIAERLYISSSPVWSPDAQQMVLTAKEVNDSKVDSHLYWIEVNSGRVEQLSFISQVAALAWSPNGQWLAIIGKTTTGYLLYLVDLHHPETLHPVTADLMFPAHVEWSRDGQQLTLLQVTGVGAPSILVYNVYRVNVDGTDLRSLSGVYSTDIDQHSQVFMLRPIK